MKATKNVINGIEVYKINFKGGINCEGLAEGYRMEMEMRILLSLLAKKRIELWMTPNKDNNYTEWYDKDHDLVEKPILKLIYKATDGVDVYELSNMVRKCIMGYNSANFISSPIIENDEYLDNSFNMFLESGTYKIIVSISNKQYGNRTTLSVSMYDTDIDANIDYYKYITDDLKRQFEKKNKNKYNF